MDSLVEGFDRNEILDRVLINQGQEWLFLARQYLLICIPPGWEGMFEDIRHILTEAGLPQPRKSAVWGALTNMWITEGLLEKTGRFGQPKDEKSESSRKQILRRADSDMVPRAWLLKQIEIVKGKHRG
jgi:hypothetical protein